MSNADKELCEIVIRTMIEKLQQANDCAWFCLGDLRVALREASATEALLLLPMIKTAAELQMQIHALNEALRTDHNAPAAAVDRLNPARMVEEMTIELAQAKENVAKAREDATKAIDAFLRKDQEYSDALRAFNAAINFSLDHAGPEGIVFLDLWREGNWESIATEFPEFNREDTETVIVSLQWNEIDIDRLRDENKRLKQAVESMRCAGGKDEFQAAFDRAKALVSN